VVARLVPLNRRGGALSLFIGGITVANLLGLPAGTAIGVALGWRATFLAVAAIGLLAVLALLWRLPNVPGAHQQAASFTNQVRALRHHQVWMSYLIIASTMVGVLVFGTYQVPKMIEITGLTEEIVPLYLLLGGMGSVLGIYAGGRATDWKPMPWLIGVLVVQAVLFFTMAAFSLHDRLLLALNIFALSMAGFAFSTPLQARVIHAAREAPNLASALISSAFN